jgi:hypothetical protein
MIFIISDATGSLSASDQEFTDLDEAFAAVRAAIDNGAHYVNLEWDDDDEG